MIKKPLYQPWNEEDFQSDIHVRGMNHTQKWIYRTLLLASFFCSERPYLPDDDEMLWVLAGCENIEEWKTNKSKILKRFIPIIIDEVALLKNKRVSADWDKLVELRDRMTILGEKSAEIRRNLYGTAQPNRTEPERIPNERSGDGLATAEQDKEREEKVSEVKESKDKEPFADSYSDSEQEKFGSGTFKNIAIHYHSFFGISHSHARKCVEQYSRACRKHGEDTLLACFDEWAPQQNWLKERRDNFGLNFFYAVLDEIVEGAQLRKEREAKEESAAGPTMTEEQVQEQIAAQQQATDAELAKNDEELQASVKAAKELGLE